MNIFSIEKNGLKRTDCQAIENYQSYNMPILYLSGNVSGMTKDDTVTLDYIYQDKAGTCTLKWQGSSSANLPKKNYTIKFDKSFEVVSGWGSQKKYCLKANFVDSSHARNVVCAKLWGQIVKSRATANTTLNALPNGGAVDGFPIIISLNGVFHGLYTWNIPKDDWMFGMDGTGQQAIVCAELNNNGAVAFNGLAILDETDFSLEYSSDDQSEWVVTSLNRLLAAVKDSDGTNITYGITPYLDWDSAIDYYCHAVLTANYDGLHRNYLLATYDGVKWFFTGYDMDVVLGLRAMGRYFYPANHSNMSFTTMAAEHKLWGLIWKYMRPQLRARYTELRQYVMSVENVANTFVDFVADIASPVYVDDIRKWGTIPSSGANNLSQIITYYDLRCRNADEWIKNTSGETALPTQVNTSVWTITNSLSNCTNSNSATTVAKNGTYTANITANSGYELSNVVVKMDNVDVTSTTYSNGAINISSVTGNVVITATAIAIEVSGYVNQMPISIDSNKNVYNNVGWKGSMRLSSSSGSEKSESYAAITGFIPVKSGDIIRMKYTGTQDVWTAYDNGSKNSFVYYDSSFTYLGGATPQPAIYGICTNNDVPTGTIASGGIVTATVPNNTNIAYVRISVAVFNNDISDLIVTVNQEITE